MVALCNKSRLEPNDPPCHADQVKGKTTFACMVCTTNRAPPANLQVGRVDEDAGSVTSSHTASGGRRSSGRRVTFSPPDKGEKEPQEDNFLQVPGNLNPDPYATCHLAYTECRIRLGRTGRRCLQTCIDS
jgi:hypothetical protein